jgi:hypothetical protein
MNFVKRLIAKSRSLSKRNHVHAKSILKDSVDFDVKLTIISMMFET